MDKYYYIDSKGIQSGPVSPIEFKRYGINRNTLVWKHGMTNWTPAGNIPQLAPFVEARKEGRKILWWIPAICGFLFLLFIILIVAANFMKEDSEVDTEDAVILVTESPEDENLEFKKNLAKSALLRAQNDITLAKEAFHRWPENHKANIQLYRR